MIWDLLTQPLKSFDLSLTLSSIAVLKLYMFDMESTSNIRALSWVLAGFKFDCILNPFFHHAVSAFVLDASCAISLSRENSSCALAKS